MGGSRIKARKRSSELENKANLEQKKTKKKQGKTEKKGKKLP